MSCLFANQVDGFLLFTVRLRTYRQAQASVYRDHNYVMTDVNLTNNSNAQVKDNIFDHDYIRRGNKHFTEYSDPQVRNNVFLDHCAIMPSSNLIFSSINVCAKRTKQKNKLTHNTHPPEFIEYELPSS